MWAAGCNTTQTIIVRSLALQRSTNAAGLRLLGARGDELSLQQWSSTNGEGSLATTLSEGGGGGVGSRERSGASGASGRVSSAGNGGGRGWSGDGVPGGGAEHDDWGSCHPAH